MKTIFSTEDIFRISAAHGASPGSLVATLQDIQAACNHLPKKALEILSRRTGHSLVDLYGLVTFHPALTLERRGAQQISLCRQEIERRVPLAEDPRFFRVNVACPACNRGLLSYDQRLDGHPMVLLHWTIRQRQGWLRLSSLWGDYRFATEHPIATHTITQFSCPKCDAELQSDWLCSRCDAPMIPLVVRSGGVIRFCSRQGCEEHMLDFGD